MAIARKPLFYEVYTAPEYFGHYNVGVLTADVRVGVHYGELTFIDAYDLARMNTDTSSGQTAFGTQLFLNNYAEIGGSLRIKPLSDLPVGSMRSRCRLDLVDQTGRWRRLRSLAITTKEHGPQLR